MDNDIKIGILIPKSQQYPSLDKDFIRGLKLNNLNVKFFVESIGVGADEKLIIDKIQKLNFQEDVSIIIGFMGHCNMSEVYNYASNNDILFLAADLGATTPYQTSEYEGIFINSLGLTDSCYYLGQYFTNKKYQIASSTSFYDSGYGLLAALEYAFKEKNQFTGHYITPFIPRENEALHMDHTINTQQPNAVFAFYSGLYAEENATFLKQNKLTQKYPFYVTPFFINDKILEEYKNNPSELYVVSSWMQNDTTSTNFTSLYKEVYNDIPSFFSVLGYENGLILKNILLNADSLKTSSLIEEMYKLDIDGPRGNIRFDTTTNRTLFNHYIYQLNLDSFNTISFRKIETLLNDGGFIKAFASLTKPDHIGGWDNAYLCH
ncbi:ABC transporter substrate-binding protein [Flavobacterium tyrosinilyticum]|uniref:ABC transporter substrate-binding protein n=1 Tax=Flavobacterium tyrosinilyticum TaxID=1658740 RepID=UPI0020309D2F|nr:ABC transporter substrate-binding protein [Flavobacterium tyrosinilyticum]MCM0668837.1 ABC transporter substrate-binding protein [Flavobacterium tyrosinilyticum]